MLLLPIRTESPVRRTPTANYLLIGANVVLYLLCDIFAPALLGGFKRRLMLLTFDPSFYQFFSYQFIHASLGHLLGNMLFLWVFGNAVNAKMGHGPYLLFYLAGGVFAAWGFTMLGAGHEALLGASGAIAAVTTAYLVLFPRSQVVILSLLFVIGFFRVPAMVLILVKIILWDVVVGPRFEDPGNVAHTAHLAGYAYGFAGALAMVLARGVQRDHFDLLALWERAYRRVAWRRAAKGLVAPGAAGGVLVPSRLSAARSDAETLALDRTSELREAIAGRVTSRDLETACRLHQELLALDPKQCLAERDQLQIGRAHYASGRFAPSAAAFEAYLRSYPSSPEANGVALLTGIIYARDLQKYERADELLSACLNRAPDAQRREQCLHWLIRVRAGLGRPAPEA